MYKSVECIHLASEFSKSIKTSKQSSKVSNKLNIKSAGNNSIGHNNPCDTFTNLSQFRIKNVNRLIIGHLNINSISGKFDQLKYLIEKIIDVLIFTETKIDACLPNSQFIIDGYSPPFRYDRNRFGGGFLIHILLCGGFNSEFLLKYDSKNLVIEKTCFENPENPRCIDLFLTNSVQSF